MQTESTQNPETGAAGLLIELRDSVITITHSQAGKMLGVKPAVKGDWDKLVTFLREELGVEWVVHD